MKPRILFLDDDKRVLASIRRQMRKFDYDFIYFPTGAEALEFLEENSVEVVFSDHKMPDMLGTEFLNRVRITHPHIVRALISGFADMSIILSAINECEVYRFVPKPWEEEQLLQAIQDCVAKSERISHEKGGGI